MLPSSIQLVLPCVCDPMEAVVIVLFFLSFAITQEDFESRQFYLHLGVC